MAGTSPTPGGTGVIKQGRPKPAVPANDQPKPKTPLPGSYGGN